MYKSLTKVYYVNHQDHEKEYQSRFNSANSVKMPLHIKAWKGNNYQLFYVNTLEITQTIINIYEKINENLRLYKAISDSDDSAFMNNYKKEMLIDEIMATNEIEGVRSSRKELKEAQQAVESKHKKPRFYYVVKKYNNLLNDEKNDLRTPQDLRKIYDELISEEIDKENSLDGKLFRKESVDVVDASGRGSTIHQGIYGEVEIERHMDMLLSFMNTENNIPSLIKISIFQYYFGYVHPFYDGNGRVSRYLMSTYLSEIDTLLAFKVSKVIFDNAKTYYGLFDDTNQELNKGDLTPFITGMLKFFEIGVHEINNDLNKYHILFSKFTEYIKHEDKIKKLDKDTISVLFVIFQSTLYRNELSLVQIQKSLDRSYRTVKHRVETLMSLDLVYRKEHSDYKLSDEMMEEIYKY